MLMFVIKINELYFKRFELLSKNSKGYPGHSKNLGIGAYDIYKPVLSEEETHITSRSIGEIVKLLAQCMKDETMEVCNLEIITYNKK